MGKILVYKKSNFLFKHRNVNSYIFFKSKFLQKKKKLSGNPNFHKNPKKGGL